MRRLKALSLIAAMLLISPLAIAGSDGREREAEIKGFVEKLPSSGLIGDWVVSGQTVRVSATTRIDQEHGPAVVGAFVEVKGTFRADGSIDATRIEVEFSPAGQPGEAEIKGFIESLPSGGLIGDWTVRVVKDGATVGTVTVHVSAATRIDQEHGRAVVGAFVEVKGTFRADGSIDATRIEVEFSPAGQPGEAEIRGFIESLPSGGLIGDWTVRVVKDGATVTVHVSATTRIDQEHGPAVVGAFVEVKGTARDDGSIDATRIEVQAVPGDRINFVGVVESLPSGGLIGQWRVSGKTVRVTLQTRLNMERGPVMVGSTVKVKGLLLADGSIEARKIQVR